MLTGKERLIISMNHEEADRIPVDFCGTPSSGIHIEAYSRLLKHLNIFDIPKVFDLLQFLALPNEDIIKYFRSDIILLPRLCPRFGIQIDEYKPYITQKGTLCQVPKGFEPVISDESVNILDHDGNILAKMPNGGLYFDFVYAEHARIENSDHADQASFSVFTDHEISYLKNKALELSSKTDKAMVGAFGGSIFESCQRSMGFENCMINLMTNEDMMLHYINRLTETHLHNLKRYLEAVGEHIQVIQFSDDLGSQDSLLISPELYRKFIKPYHTRMFDYVKQQYPHIKVLLHSCGSIQPLISDLIESGVDALNPVQISAKNMDPVTLKRKFGSNIVWWGGGANMQYTVKYGNIEKISKEVRELCGIFKASGGFVFAPVHNIQADIEPEKIIEIYTAAYSCAEYK